MLGNISVRLRSLIHRGAFENDLDDELRFHFEQQVEHYIQSGLPRDEAMRRTRIEFGGLDQVKERCREARGIHFIETLT
jgi:hypothetical protein